MLAVSGVATYLKLKKACIQGCSDADFCIPVEGVIKDVLRMNMGYLDIKLLALLEESCEDDHVLLVQKPLLTFSELAKDICEQLGPATIALVPAAKDEVSWQKAASFLEKCLWDREFFKEIY